MTEKMTKFELQKAINEEREKKVEEVERNNQELRRALKLSQAGSQSLAKENRDSRQQLEAKLIQAHDSLMTLLEAEIGTLRTSLASEQSHNSDLGPIL